MLVIRRLIVFSVLLPLYQALDLGQSNATILSINCSGKAAIRTTQALSVVKCNTSMVYKICGPVEVSTTDWKRVIIGPDCQMFSRTLEVQVIVLWVVLAMIILCILIIVIAIIGLLSTVKNDGKAEFLSKGVMVRDGPSSRLFSYKSLVVLGLASFKIQTSTQLCIQPYSLEETRLGSTYKYLLSPNTSACFLDGSVFHSTSDSIIDTTLLYKTASWSHLTWSKLACGNADCGTTDECSVWGDHGLVVHNSGGKSQYKKFCRTNLRPWISCFYGWGCWLATNEISWANEQIWEVKAIGNPSPSDSYIVSGLDGCTVALMDTVASTTKDDYLISRGLDSKICKFASEEGFPVAGRIGDLQIVDGQNASFDYSAFSCDLGTAYSSGSCRVMHSAMSYTETRCLALPTNVAMEHLWFDGSELHSISLGAREFTIHCNRNLTIHTSNHNCHSIRVVVQGIRSEQDFMFVSFRADSPNSSSTYKIDESCHMERVEIPCDGEDHIIRAYTYPLDDCFPQGSSFSDKTTTPESPTWSWDHTDHHVFGPSGSTTSVLIYLAGFILALVIIKMLIAK